MTTKKKHDLSEYVTINADASVTQKEEHGGYGIWIKTSHYTIKKAGKFKEPISDSNEAEIKAVLNALHILSKKKHKYKVCVINCDNDTVGLIVNKKQIPKRFKDIGEQLLEFLSIYELAYAKNIKGHSNKNRNSRNWVNHWCDKNSRNYKKQEYDKARN